MRLWFKKAICKLGFGDSLIEFCERCGIEQPLVWWCHDKALWNLVAGADNRCFCPKCFDQLAEAKGIVLQWGPKVIVATTEQMTYLLKVEQRITVQLYKGEDR